jgi:hypothetical protein
MTMTFKALLGVSFILASSVLGWMPIHAQEAEPAVPEAEPAAAEAAAPRRAAVVEPPAPRSLDYLPPPLETIRGDLRELEATGHFTIAGVALTVQLNGDEAVIWTIVVNRPVTCRHIEQVLRQYRDVRFYATLNNTRQELYTTVMQYSERVSLGTINKQLLLQDDQFEVWVPLDKTAQRRLLSFKSDTATFRPWEE